MFSDVICLCFFCVCVLVGRVVVMCFGRFIVDWLGCVCVCDVVGLEEGGMWKDFCGF